MSHFRQPKDDPPENRYGYDLSGDEDTRLRLG